MRPDPDREPHARPHHLRFGHSIADFVTDPYLDPCPDGFACPIYQSGAYTYAVANTSSNADAFAVARRLSDPHPDPAAD